MWRRYGDAPYTILVLGVFTVELVSLGQRRAAVEQAKDVSREAQRAGEHPVGSRGPGVGPPEDALRLPREQSCAAHAVAPHVHERAALDVRSQPDVRLVEQRVAEDRPYEAKLTDGARRLTAPPNGY